MTACGCLCHVNHAREMRRQAAALRSKADELRVTAAADCKALEEQAAGLIQRAEAEESGPQ